MLFIEKQIVLNRGSETCSDSGHFLQSCGLARPKKSRISLHFVKKIRFFTKLSNHKLSEIIGKIKKLSEN